MGGGDLQAVTKADGVSSLDTSYSHETDQVQNQIAGKLHGRHKDLKWSARITTISKALRNFAHFHGIPVAEVNIDDILSSSAGIHGWAGSGLSGSSSSSAELVNALSSCRGFSRGQKDSHPMANQRAQTHRLTELLGVMLLCSR
jgi:hypothetical protein